MPPLPEGFWQRQHVHDALTSRDFGALFRLASKYAGASQTDIAVTVGMTQGQVSTIMAGTRRITALDVMERVFDGMLAPGDARIACGLAPRDSAGVVPDAASAARWLRSFGADGGGEVAGDSSVLRRDVLRLGGSSAVVGVGLTLTGPAVGGGGGRLGSGVPAQLRARTARLRRLDNVLGGGDTFRVYLQEYESTVRLLREYSYTEAVGQELLSVLSEQAQQAGWAAFDAGDDGEARRLYEASYAAANRAGDAPLAGNALAFLAYQRIGDDKGAALRIAEESCLTAGPDAPGGVRALLHERLAWAHAVAGNTAETERELVMAQEALSQLSEQRQPDWTTWVDQNELQIMTGRCWTELRRPLRAVPVLERVLADFDDAHARDKALYLCWLADAYLCAAEIEQAAEVVRRVVDLSAGVASVRPRQRLTPVLRELAGYRTVPAVREALEAAQA
jgi:tetratricopeptide (TPR) repeat protein